MARIVALVAPILILVFATACDRKTGQTQTCSSCNGSGRAKSGSACSVCSGRGYRDVTASEVSRRKLGEENLRRRENGEAPLSDSAWWWETAGKGLAGLAVVAVVVHLLQRSSRPRSNPPGNPSPPTV